jgi:iron complex outermembrane receptor protein
VFSVGSRMRWSVKSHLSRSFRAPTFADLFYQDARIEGKPDLAPEKSRNVDIGLGVEITTWGRISAGFTHFQNTIEDLIVWKMGSFEVFRPFNTDARITGQELSFEFTVPDEIIGFHLGYTHLHALNKSDNMTTRDKVLPYRPEKSLKAALTLHLLRWRATMRYRYVGKRFTNEANTVEMPPYRVVDLDMSWKQHIRTMELTWTCSVLNVLNEAYEIIRDMPLPGREWRLGLGIKI